MFDKVIAAAVVLAVATPSFADETQLSRLTGVQPGAYSVAELAALRQAQEDRDTIRIRQIKDRGRVAVFRRLHSAGQSGEMTVAEKFTMSAAIDDRNDHAVRFIQAKLEGRHVVHPADHVTPGEAQIARTLGVDPTQYTLAELAAIKAAVEDDDD